MRRLTILMTATALLAGAGCSWQSEDTRDDAQHPSMSSTQIARQPYAGSMAQSPASSLGDVGWVAASIAQQQLGSPYRYGGNGPGGFDCSGLVHFAYAEAGVDVPRTTGGLWQATDSVRREQLRPGDILFFRIDGKPGHVGIYLGEDYFVHAPSTGKTVSTRSLNDRYYANRLIRGGRLVD